jgi:hypothetical protein
MSDSTELTVLKTEIQTSISDFSGPFADYLTNLGLPIEGVLAPIDERKIVINSIENEINKIPEENRHLAVYLTRFLSSVAAGLFDGAVTYLWNETIKSLRHMIANYDLDYFMKVTAELNNRYKNLKTEEDLALIADYDLLSTCNRMGLITDHVFEVFKFINYMRNHSSAAHPNENEISAYDLLSWLNNCIKYAINAEPNGEAVELKKLLYNLRTNEIPEEDYEYIGDRISTMPTVMVEDFLSSIFGMYTDPKTAAKISHNIEGIAKYVWDVSTEPKKHEIGEKYGYFRKNGDTVRKDKANAFLTIVGGQAYKDEDSISYEIKGVLANLMSTHNSFNNFYNEAPWARQLKEMIPVTGTIPDSILNEWVKTIVVCYCGNGLGYRDGVDEGAVQYYQEFINSFDEKAIVCLLNMMDDSILLMDMGSSKVSKRFRGMCTSLKDKTQNAFITDTLDYLINCNEGILKAHKTTAYKTLLEKVNAKIKIA